MKNTAAIIPLRLYCVWDRRSVGCAERELCWANKAGKANQNELD